MKNKLGRKFIISNVIIVITSLFVFCVFAIQIFSNFMYDNMKEQLLVENRSVSRMQQVRNMIVSGRDGNDNALIESELYQSLSDSINLVYSKEEGETEYALEMNSEEDFTPFFNVENLVEEIDDSEDQITIIDNEGIEYLVTGTIIEAKRANQGETVVISLVSLTSVSQVTDAYIWGFIVVSILLASIGTIVTIIISRRTTAPIHKLMGLTKRYARRDFSEQYIASTGDEIQELSESISEMADSLQKYNVERDKLFRHISHELKTPLTAIYGYAEGVKNGVFEKDDEALDIIMSESIRIKKLTEDLIFLSKLESNVEEFKFEKNDLTGTIIKAIQSVESLAILKDIDIIYEPVMVAKICYDEDKIHRALVNILGNCIKYTRDMISIEVKEREIKDQHFVEIMIKDNGNGFETEDFDRLLKGMTKEKSNGSGIGLSIVSEIMKAHDGKLSIGNNKEGGAVFRLQLKN